MEIEDEDPFNFRSLKRVKKSTQLQAKKQTQSKFFEANSRLRQGTWSADLESVGLEHDKRHGCTTSTNFEGKRVKSKCDKKSTQSELKGKVKSALKTKSTELSSKIKLASAVGLTLSCNEQNDGKLRNPTVAGNHNDTESIKDEFMSIPHYKRYGLGPAVANGNETANRSEQDGYWFGFSENASLSSGFSSMKTMRVGCQQHLHNTSASKTLTKNFQPKNESHQQLTEASNIIEKGAVKPINMIPSLAKLAASVSRKQISQEKKHENTDVGFENNILCMGLSSSQITGNDIGQNKADQSVKVMESDVQEERCPFCQVPFRVLHGQSPDWHTMECMDIPLKTTEECPSGLKCESNLPGHYRRYCHSQLALHLAGQHHSSMHSPHGAGLQSETVERQGDTVKKILPSLPSSQDWLHKMEKIKSSQETVHKKSPRQRKRKSTSKTRRERRSVSQQGSQGSQTGSGESSGSILSYFSPSKVKTSHDTRHDLDPVLKLLIMSDSDSNENTEHMTETESDTKCERVTVNSGTEQNYAEAVNSDQATDSGPSESADALLKSRDDRDDLRQVSNDQDGLTESTDDEVVITDAYLIDKNGNNRLVVSEQLGTDTDSLQNQVLQTPANLFGIQKQTSLLSFFKDHRHSASKNPKQQTVDRVPSSSSLSSPRVKPGENRQNCFQTGRNPSLAKSVSSPGKLMRIPSPPPAALVNTVATKDSARQRISKGRPLKTAPSTSFHNMSGRQCPFYKKLPGTAITVDAFCYGEIEGCHAYILTHFHYDHYRGLTKKFSQPIYCSVITANLVEKQIGVCSQWVNRLPMNSPQQVAGVWLTLMEANHCPGAVIILFELPDGRKLLHTGDFRADPCMEQYPPLVGISVDELYLDTTYCDPTHAFPSQSEAIQFAVSTALGAVEKDPSTLIVCGAYTIGKERIFIALAEALQTKICVQLAKKRVLDCLESERLRNMITLNLTDGCVHVLPMRQLNARGLQQHLDKCPHFSSVLAFEPTGWTHSNKVLSLNNLSPKFTSHNITVYGVPYSEHSSFLELRRFVQFLRPRRILPTVNNGNAACRRKMESFFKQWLSDTGHSGQRSPRLPAQPSLGIWLTKCGSDQP